jgi:hypothetical protein
MRQAAAVREHKHAGIAPLASLLVCGLLGCHAYDAELIDLRTPQAASAVSAAGGGMGPVSSSSAAAGRTNDTTAGPIAVGTAGVDAASGNPEQGGVAGLGHAGAGGVYDGAGSGSASAGVYGGAGTAPAGPGRCGDGVVQMDRGETCDPGTDEFAPACPAAADCNDNNACTRDTLKGSAAACDAVCEHAALSSSLTADGCCPASANATTDSDCTPRCGNGAREGSEQCDGGSGCDSSCKLTMPTAEQQCISTLASDSCEVCECTYCATAFTACSASGNSARDAACTSVETCAAEKDCAGQACYCGDTSPTSLDCTLRPNGACRREVEAAAGSGLALVIDAQYNDPSSALGRARTLGECRRQKCSAACPAN